MTDVNRREALQDLLHLRKPVTAAARLLKSFPWDSDHPLVTLTRGDARNALDRYLDGAISTEELEQWANAIEGRDDIGFESGSEELLKDFVFQISTPEITRRLGKAVATEWRERLT
ncbi:MAG: hypothetical protein M3Z28_11170 [Candidatus Dormibacteraeota bacterium]|nr:hypothetical protein [Candidatus Dormibacteraeota bacterium]